MLEALVEVRGPDRPTASRESVLALPGGIPPGHLPWLQLLRLLRLLRQEGGATGATRRMGGAGIAGLGPLAPAYGRADVALAHVLQWA